MSTTSNKICNDGASKSNDDGVCEVKRILQNMSTVDIINDEVLNICANCGKEGSDVNNTCNKCKTVMYCNASCKKKHRHKHKKECEEHQRLDAEQAAKLHDKKLFKQSPPMHEDCPICFLRMPTLLSGSRYKSCCGKLICSGCIHAVRIRDGDVGLCPFCRAAAPLDYETTIERTKKQVKAGDTKAMNSLGLYYDQGQFGLPQNYTKAMELWHQAGELGCAQSYHNIACSYRDGDGVKRNEEKAIHYNELAAMAGCVAARDSLGFFEEWAGNVNRAMKHWMIAVKSGDNNSLKNIQRLYSNGRTAKEDYTAALQAYQTFLGEIKSVQRDEAAAFHESYKYIE